MILPRYPRRGEYILYKHYYINGFSLSICKVLNRDRTEEGSDKRLKCKTYKIIKIVSNYNYGEWDGINVWIRTSKNVECEISKDLESLLERYCVEIL